jgi:hypothetical protein
LTLAFSIILLPLPGFMSTPFRKVYSVGEIQEETESGESEDEKKEGGQ